MRVISEAHYLCDMCNRRAHNHFKVKVPIADTKLKKWERFDMCESCYMELYKKCIEARKNNNKKLTLNQEL